MVKITHKLLEKVRSEFHRREAQDYFANSLLHLFGVVPLKPKDIKVLRQTEFEFTITPVSKHENEIAASIVGASAKIFADIVNEDGHDFGTMIELFIPKISRAGDLILVECSIQYQANK